jgi:hypothetical protein
MPRRQPASAKQRKVQLQGRRALKRGDIDLLSVKPKPSRRGPNTPFTAESSSRRLQSRFISVSPDYLDLTRDLAHNTRLPRPIPASSAEFPIDILVGQDAVRKLSCPGRPKFRVGATKKEVEGNEEGWFRKWLEGMEEVMRNWVEGEDSKEDDVEGPEGGQEEGSSRWPRSTSWFETNLEVWRQLYALITT